METTPPAKAKPAPPPQPFTAAQWNAYMVALSAWEAAQRTQGR
jgi:hypothetical protein